MKLTKPMSKWLGIGLYSWSTLTTILADERIQNLLHLKIINIIVYNKNFLRSGGAGWGAIAGSSYKQLLNCSNILFF